MQQASAETCRTCGGQTSYDTEKAPFYLYCETGEHAQPDRDHGVPVDYGPNSWNNRFRSLV